MTSFEFLNFRQLLIFSNVKFVQKSKFKAQKLLKQPFLTFWIQPKLISRIIRVAGKLLNFHTVENPVRNPNWMPRSAFFFNIPEKSQGGLSAFFTLSRRFINRTSLHVFPFCGFIMFRHEWASTKFMLGWFNWKPIMGNDKVERRAAVKKWMLLIHSTGCSIWKSTYLKSSSNKFEHGQPN